MFYCRGMVLSHLKATPAITEITTAEECDAVLSQGLAIVFKHSPSCPVSWMAHREVIRFHTAQPSAPIYLVSVRKFRDLARLIAERTGIRHESPQIIVMQDGRVAGTVSHSGVTAEFLSAFS
jgi:bacillithiol system protein YtxJ